MASVPATTPATTIDPAATEHFGAMAADWWNPKGSSAMLHRLNPVRLAYLRERIDAHWPGDHTGFAPLSGRTALDVGCGAGLLCEPLARLGAHVTGLDPAPENVAAAQAHAMRSGLAIDYRIGSVEGLGVERFDLVTALEVVEHVSDPMGFVSGLAGALAADGLLVISTPNRTALSRLAMIGIGERIAGIPRGTHDWDKFLKPDELVALVEAAGLKVIDTRGLGFSVAKGFVLSDDMKLDYFIAAARR